MTEKIELSFDEFRLMIHRARGFLDRSQRVIGSKGERRVCALFDNRLEIGVFDDVFGGRPVKYEREVRVPAGNIDRVITNADGSLSVVEVKDAGDRRHLATGIGQVLMYSIAIRDVRPASEVRPVMVVGCRGKVDQWVGEACRQNGIELITIELSRFGEIEKFYKGDGYATQATGIYC